MERENYGKDNEKRGRSKMRIGDSVDIENEEKLGWRRTRKRCRRGNG